MRAAPAAVVLAAISIAGCGGPSPSNDRATTAGATDTPSPAVSAFAHASHGRHHRHRHHEYGSDAIAASARPAPSGGTWPCDDRQFTTDQQGFATGALQGDQEVDVCGTVTDVLPSRTTRSGSHGYYDLQVAPGTTIEIVCDLDRMDAPPWPWVKAGDYSYVQGRYYYDSATAQGIDWTHHGTSRSWSTPGYVVVGGTEYQ